MRIRAMVLLLALLGPGCEAPAWLTRAVSAIPGVKQLLSRDGCAFGDPVACPAEKVCAYTTPEHSECVPRFVGPTPFLKFPFETGHAVACTQGPGKRGGTHTSVEMLFGIDLATRPADALPGTVFAGMDGTALVFRSCADASVMATKGLNKDQPEICKKGIGNHVRVLNPDGHMLLYGHLGAIWVDDGQVVRAGEALGVEGQSGYAPERHLHFSVHYAAIESWLETLSYYRLHPGAAPPSIPFETQFCDPSEPKECLRRRARMDQLPCAAKDEPILRADWRD